MPINSRRRYPVAPEETRCHCRSCRQMGPFPVQMQATFTAEQIRATESADLVSCQPTSRTLWYKREQNLAESNKDRNESTQVGPEHRTTWQRLSFRPASQAGHKKMRLDQSALNPSVREAQVNALDGAVVQDMGAGIRCGLPALPSFCENAVGCNSVDIS